MNIDSKAMYKNLTKQVTVKQPDLQGLTARSIFYKSVMEKAEGKSLPTVMEVLTSILRV